MVHGDEDNDSRFSKMYNVKAVPEYSFQVYGSKILSVTGVSLADLQDKMKKLFKKSGKIC